jgi:hypothetical protein
MGLGKRNPGLNEKEERMTGHVDASDGWCCDGRTYHEHADVDGECCQAKGTKLEDLPPDGQQQARERMESNA